MSGRWLLHAEGLGSPATDTPGHKAGLCRQGLLKNGLRMESAQLRRASIRLYLCVQKQSVDSTCIFHVEKYRHVNLCFNCTLLCSDSSRLKRLLQVYYVYTVY